MPLRHLSSYKKVRSWKWIFWTATGIICFFLGLAIRWQVPPGTYTYKTGIGAFFVVVGLIILATVIGSFIILHLKTDTDSQDTLPGPPPPKLSSQDSINSSKKS